MKSIKVIGYGLMVMVALLVSAPTVAQEWQSTSTMQGSGSSYSSQVTAVGATSAVSAATTTESYSPASGPKRAKLGLPDTPSTKDDEGNVPVGDALIPLLLCACMYLSVRVFLKRKRALKGE